jgi:hypothetical protein
LKEVPCHLPRFKDASLSDDARHQLGRRHVKGGVAGLSALNGEALPIEEEHLARRVLLKRMG